MCLENQDWTVWETIVLTQLYVARSSKFVQSSIDLSPYLCLVVCEVWVPAASNYSVVEECLYYIAHVLQKIYNVCYPSVILSAPELPPMATEIAWLYKTLGNCEITLCLSKPARFSKLATELQLIIFDLLIELWKNKHKILEKSTEYWTYGFWGSQNLSRELCSVPVRDVLYTSFVLV